MISGEIFQESGFVKASSTHHRPGFLIFQQYSQKRSDISWAPIRYLLVQIEQRKNQNSVLLVQIEQRKHQNNV